MSLGVALTNVNLVLESSGDDNEIQGYGRVSVRMFERTHQYQTGWLSPQKHTSCVGNCRFADVEVEVSGAALGYPRVECGLGADRDAHVCRLRRLTGSLSIWSATHYFIVTYQGGVH